MNLIVIQELLRVPGVFAGDLVGFPENAQRVRARIAALGNVQVVPAEVNGAALYRVRLGPVTNGAEADRLLNKVVGSGYPTARIVSE